MVDVALLEQCTENILDYVDMVFGARCCIEVPTNAEAFPRLQELGVELGGDFRGSAALLFGANGDRRPVQIAAGDHEDAIARGAVVAGEDVSGKIGADDLADV